MKFARIYFLEKKKKFWKNLGRERESIQILENPKNFMISFFHPLSLDRKKSSTKFSFSFSPECFVFSQKNHFFSPNKMRFSIQVQDEPKMFFHVLPAAEKATGLNQQTISKVLERGNKVYHRQSDHKLFTISKEDPILIAKIEGEDFFSLEEIHEKFGLSPTKFLNQIKSGKFAKKIDWILDELFPEKAKQEKEKPDEIKILREEMKFQFESIRQR